MKLLLRSPALLLCTGLLAVALLRAAEPAVEDTVITADNFDTKGSDNEVTTLFWDNVVVTGTNLRIKCDRLEVISFRNADRTQLVAKQNRFKSLVATGHVTILQVDSNREATCGKAVVLPAEDRITLTDHPQVIDSDPDGKPAWTWTGEELFMLRGERQIRGTKVKITAPQIKNLGFDKNLPPPAVEAPPSAATPPASPTITVPNAGTPK